MPRSYNKTKDGKKVCPSCDEEKDVSEFYPNKRGTPAGKCKPCCLEYNKRTDKATKAESGRRSHLRNKYGITLEQYNDMLKKQKECCAICSRHQSEFKTRLAVDHNHATGEIRGLLCSYCNHRIVGRHRNGDLLRRIADYVDQGTGWFVPKRKRPVKRKPKRK